MCRDHSSYDVDTFHDDLVAHELIIPSEIEGAYGRGTVFEDILQRFDQLVSRATADDGAQHVMFPPIVPRKLIEKVGYMDNFPHLSGSISSFHGDERQARMLSERVNGGERWEDMLEITDAMLTPAACYPAYPMFQGKLPPNGRLLTLTGWVYRHEPSHEPTRLQAFRMREFVRAGTEKQVVEWRDAWLDRALALLRSLQLPVSSDVAHDPFFGRAGKIMAASQRDQKLKFEILCPVISSAEPTAICSFNWHQDHFSTVFGIETSDGKTASTACLGFGLERVTLALLKVHGFDPLKWPAAVRSLLWP